MRFLFLVYLSVSVAYAGLNLPESVLAHKSNARLRKIMDNFHQNAPVVLLNVRADKKVLHVVRVPFCRVAKSARSESNINVLDKKVSESTVKINGHDVRAIVFTNILSTTDHGGHVSHPGPRGNWYTKPTDPYIALPAYALRGRRVLVRSCETGLIVELPVWDTGPFSTEDNFIDEGRRPWAERGYTNLARYRGKVPHRAPAADITPAGWRLLGHDPGNTYRKQYNYASYVDIIRVIDGPVQMAKAD